MKSLAAILGLLVVAACSSGGGGGGHTIPIATATPTAVPTATPTPPARLYAGGDGLPSNAIAYFTAPFSSASTPTGSITTGVGGELAGLAIDPNGNVIASDQSLHTVTGYARPNPTTTTQFTLSPGFTTEGIAYGPTGTFYVANGTANEVEAAPAPLSAATTFTPLITTGLSDPDDICFDMAGNLYVLDYAAGNISAYAPPYTGTATVVASGFANTDNCAYDSTTNQLIVNSLDGFTSNVLVFNLPLTAASVPSANLSFTSTSSGAVAADKSGNLYVSTDIPTMQVFKPPFVSATNPTPLFSFPLANGATEIMAFGT